MTPVPSVGNRVPSRTAADSVAPPTPTTVAVPSPSSLCRDEGDRTATVVGVGGATLSAAVRLGTRLPTDGTGVIATVLRERRPHRMDDYAGATGTMASVGRERIGLRTAVGCPIVVGGRI